MTELTQSLDRILAWLQHNDPEGASGFRPGLSSENISKKLQELPFKVSREVQELYQWRDGDTRCESVFICHWLLPLDDALAVSQEHVNCESSIDLRLKDGEPHYLFPLFEFEGEFFAVLGQETYSDTAPIFHISNCCDVSTKPVFNSLAGMMKTLAECYETGLYETGLSFIESDIGLDTDSEQFYKIRHRYNPGTAERVFA